MKYSPKWYDNHIWLALMYVEQGLKIPEIAEKAGVSDETIRKLLIKYDLMRGKI
jgi:transposase